jgi:hypothetical protein
MVTICTTCFNSQQLSMLYLWALNNLIIKQIISLNSINQLIFVMVKCCVLFEVRTELLNII